MSGRLEGIPGKNRIQMIWREYRLVEKGMITPRIKKFVFEIVDESSASSDTEFPGTFPHVRLKFGLEALFTRVYSVVHGDIKKFELGIARDDKSRGGSGYLHDNVKVGDILETAMGHDKTPQLESTLNILKDKKHIFIVEGIGVTAFLRHMKKT